MDRPPRKRSENIINRDMIWSIVVQALAIFVAVFAAFQIGRFLYPDVIATAVTSSRDLITDPALLAPRFSFLPWEGFIPSHGARTFAFVCLICAELLRAYSSRSDRHAVFSLGLFSNKSMVQASLASGVLLLLVIYVPFLDVIFETISLSLRDWAIILPLALLPFVIGELFKKVYYHGAKMRKA